MNEIQTAPQEPKKPTADDDFAVIKQIELNQQHREAAQRILQQNTPQPLGQESTGWGMDALPTATNDKQRRRLIKVGVVAGIAGAVVGGTVMRTIDTAPAQPPTFSEDTIPVAATDGASVYSIAEKIPGHESIDMRDAVEYISSYPANIDVLKDGLQVGEQIEVPVSINGAKSSNK